MSIDLTLAPLYRMNGREIAVLPGLLAQTPPSGAIRIRAQDRLAVYLSLVGNAEISSSDYMQLARDAANVFYRTHGSLTSALRAAAEHVNQTLFERNLAASSMGKYVQGWLTLAALRDSHCTLALSGPMRTYWFGRNESRLIHEPEASGKGLGTSQKTGVYFAQVTLSAGDRMLFLGRLPEGWEGALSDARPASLTAMRRRLSTVTRDDLNAVLIQATDGSGVMNLLTGGAELPGEKKEEQAPPPSPRPDLPLPKKQESTPEPFPPAHAETFDAAEGQPVSTPPIPAHVIQPSAYTIPPQHSEKNPRTPRAFPASIPRAKPKPAAEPGLDDETPEAALEQDEKPGRTPAPMEAEQAGAPHEPSARTRQAARTIAGGIQLTRKVSGSLGERIRNFVPRLLPSPENRETSSTASSAVMMFMAILVPLIVVTVASMVYLRYGRSEQYDTYLRRAQQMRDQAIALTDPVEQRKSWENVLSSLNVAESHRQTEETINLRREAQGSLDRLLGVARVQFNHAFSSKLGVEVSRMAASESDLFMLDAANGEMLRAVPAAGGRGGFQLDTAFNCKPGAYGGAAVGPLVDILALPGFASNPALALGIDAGGNLIYCTPGEVPLAVPLPRPDTNWGRVTAFRMQNGNLYVLDAPSRAVWVFNGKDGNFIDRPYFFFGRETPMQDVIDFAVVGDELYMLHADGRVSRCTYSRVETTSSQCEDPLPLVNPLPAYGDLDLFGSAHFIKIMLAAPPDQSLLLLDAESQGMMRFSPRLMELQNQVLPTTGADNPVPPHPVSAATVSPNHVLYFAVDGQVYFAPNMP
jgi:hypothetical protein